MTEEPSKDPSPPGDSPANGSTEPSAAVVSMSQTGDFVFEGNVHIYRARLLRMYEIALTRVAENIRARAEPPATIVVYDKAVGEGVGLYAFELAHLEAVVVEYERLLAMRPEAPLSGARGDSERQLRIETGFLRAMQMQALPQKNFTRTLNLSAMSQALAAVGSLATLAIDFVRPNIKVGKLTDSAFSVTTMAGILHRALNPSASASQYEVIDPMLHFPSAPLSGAGSPLLHAYRSVLKKMRDGSKLLSTKATELEGTALKTEIEALIEATVEHLGELTQAEKGKEPVLRSLLRLEGVAKAIGAGAFSLALTVESGGANLWTSRYMYLFTRAHVELSLAINYALLDSTGRVVDGGAIVEEHNEELRLLPVAYSRLVGTVLSVMAILLATLVLVWALTTGVETFRSTF